MYNLVLYLSFGRLFLLHLPNVVCLEQFSEGVIGLLGLYLFYLCVNGIVVGGSVHVANDAEGNGKTVSVAHEGELELERIVLTVSIVDEDIIECDTILAYLHHLKAEALLHEAKLIVFAEDEGLAVLHVDSILSATLFGIDALVGSVVEDDAVLQYFTDGSTLVGLSGLEDVGSARSIGGYGTREEMAARTEAEFCGAEGILDGAVRT